MRATARVLCKGVYEGSVILLLRFGDVDGMFWGL